LTEQLFREDRGTDPLTGDFVRPASIFRWCQLDVAKLQRSVKFGRAILFGRVGSWRNGRRLGGINISFRQ
jgi:hypothetical protein